MNRSQDHAIEVRIVADVLAEHFCGDGAEIAPLNRYEAEAVAEKVLAVLASHSPKRDE